jgi:hypothetical protein
MQDDDIVYGSPEPIDEPVPRLVIFMWARSLIEARSIGISSPVSHTGTSSRLSWIPHSDEGKPHMAAHRRGISWTG